MKTEIKHYVEFFYPKDFFFDRPENFYRKIENTGEKIEVPKNAFAYRYFERQEAIAEDGEILAGKPKNYSGKHYIGRILTLDELKKEMPYEKIQIRNLEKNIEMKGLDKIVLARGRIFQNLEKGDLVVEDKRNGVVFCEPKLS